MHALHVSKKPENVESHVLKNIEKQPQKVKKVLDYYAFVADFLILFRRLFYCQKGLDVSRLNTFTI